MQDHVEAYQLLVEKVLECNNKIAELEQERKDMTTSVSNMNTKITKKREQLSAFRVSRKTEDDSLYTAIDTILDKHDIKRAAYHGGQLTGVCVRTLMSKAEEIMTEIAQVLKGNKSDACKMSDEDINKLCNNIDILLRRWDVQCRKFIRRTLWKTIMPKLRNILMPRWT